MPMTTAILYGPLQRLKLGADGFVPRPTLKGSGACCPDPLCLPTCDIICSFVELLPTGPMWDRAKQETTAYFSGGGDYDPCDVVCTTCPCPTLVSYAVYGARLLHDMASNVLWPAIRESDPKTAITTLDDWLDRYGWQDCYRNTCVGQFASALSPYAVADGCGGKSYCAVDFPPAFELALKHAILQCLVRAQNGVIKNLDGINWVIEPLRSILRPRMPWPEGYAKKLAGDCEEPDGPECYCDEALFELCNVGDTIPAAPSLASQCNAAETTVASLQLFKCGDVDTMLYPNVIAAECIVRALMPRKCPNILFRCEVELPAEPVIPEQPQIG